MIRQIYIIIFTLVGLCLPAEIDAKTYLTQSSFMALAFDQNNVQSAEIKTLWLNKKMQSKIEKILSHPYPKLRIRYWSVGKQTAWILDEIGKEKAITFGISIINNRVKLARVLVFRENRGYEISMASFYQQFNQIGLTDDHWLTDSIDGISGATMSVNAMKKMTRLALLLHKEVIQ